MRSVTNEAGEKKKKVMRCPLGAPDPGGAELSAESHPTSANMQTTSTLWGGWGAHHDDFCANQYVATRQATSEINCVFPL